MNIIGASFLKPLRIVAFIFLCLTALPLHAQQIHTYVDKDSLRVGDEFSLSVVLDGTYTLESYPGEGSFSDSLEFIDRQRFQIAATRDSIVYSLQFFSVDDMTIGPLDFQLRTGDRDTTLKSNPLPLYFKSTLAGDDEQLRPLKPIFDFARSYWLYFLILLLLAVIGYFIFRHLKDRAQQDTFIPKPYNREPFVDPLDELEQSIQDIASDKPPVDHEEFEQLYIRLADAIRLYLKRVYEFPALEMTSGEIIRKLQQIRASSDLIKNARTVLQEADMVKFANFNPASDQVSNAIKTGERFVETVKTIDSERIDYLRHLHNKEQEEREDAHHEMELKRKKEFEQ